MKSLTSIADYGYSRGHQEDARRNCINDFFNSIINNTSAYKQASNILNHSLTTQLLSAIYMSAARQYVGKSGLIKDKIKIKFDRKTYV